MSENTHLVIRASAGTGKTYALSNRYLALLRDGAEPESMLATTFTRKAAGEILERVLGRLAAGAASQAAAGELGRALHRGPLSQGRAQQMLARLCRSLHRVSISTLDSFFNRVAQSFRHELGIPPAPMLVGQDAPIARQLRLQAIEAVLAGDTPEVLVDLFRRLHHDAAQRSVTEALDAVVGSLHEVYRQAPRAELWRGPATPGLLSAGDLARAIARLEAAAGANRAKALARGLASNVEAARLRQWEDFLSKGLAPKVEDAEPTFSRVPIPEALVEAYRPLVAHARAEFLGRVARQTQATFELLRRFDEQFAQLRRRHRVLLFADLPDRLAHQLAADADLHDLVYYRLDGRIAHLLLDEFQDTSIEQWEVLRPMAREIRSVADGSRTFFCVGDLKQAIYGWRGGCAEIFAQVEAELHLPHDPAQALNRSFRSSQVVLDTVNRVFGTLAGNPALGVHGGLAQRWREGFGRHTAADPALPGHVELLSSVPAAAEAGEDEDGPEADDEAGPSLITPHHRFVAEKVRALAAAAPGRSIGVLASTNEMVRHLIFALRQAGVEASGEGGNAVTDDPAVNAVLAALVLADHPGDSVAACHVTTSPMAAVLGLASGQPAEVHRAAAQIRRRLLAQGYSPVVAAWARALAPSCAARSVQRLTQLVELADAYQPDLTLRPSDFVDFVRDTAVEEPAPAAVRVMTVHRAKGLEFDAVVLPELHRPLGKIRGQDVYVLRDSPIGPVRAVHRAVPKKLLSLAPELQEGYDQEQARRLMDDLCALYVAMTRPRFALHLIVPPLRPKKSGEPGTRGLIDCSPAAILRQALRPADFEESYDGRQTLFAAGDPAWPGAAPWKDGPPAAAPPPPAAPPARIQLAAPGAQARRSWRQVSPSALEAGGRVRVEDLLALKTDEGRLHGRLLHAWLCAVAWLEGEAGLPPEAELLAIGRRELPRKPEAWMRQRLPRLREILRQPQIVNLLRRPPDDPEVWREREFAVRVGGELLHGRFDRVVLHRRGAQLERVELVDFKTDLVGPGPAAVAEAVERYRPQMQAYRGALAALLDLPAARVEARLAFLSIGRVCPL